MLHFTEEQSKVYTDFMALLTMLEFEHDITVPEELDKALYQYEKVLIAHIDNVPNYGA